jgi:cytochrome c oxidase subunit I+III
MFTVGLALLALSLFAGASMSIAIPSGVQIFAWIATIWSGRPVFKTPFLFAIGFILVFVLGGLSGVMVAAVPFNRQVHDTYFIVAHFHYVLIGGVVFPIFAALYYWMSIFSGRLLSERLGRWNFWLVFVGFNVAFFPQHIVGLLGMPRRYYTYPAGFGWEGLNLASTVGAYILGVGVALFVWNVVWSAFLGRGERVPGDPWGSGTLDFAASSPPGDVGYRHIPIVRGRYPMWEQDALDRGDPRYERITRGLAEYPKSWRAALVTSVLDGEPQAVMRMSGPSWWPFIFAIMITVVYAGTLFDWYVVMVLGLVGCIVSIVAWLWPSKDERELPEVDPDGTVHGLPVYVNGPRAVGWWAMAIVLLILAVVLGCLVFSYYYLRVGAAAWPPPDVELPDLGLAGVATAVLLLSAAGMWRAVAAIRRGDPRGLRLALGLSWALAIAFVGLQAFEYGRLGFGPSGHAYGSLFYTLAGTITTLAVGALIMGGVVQAQAWLGYFSARRFLAVENAALYWYFLAASWTITAAVLYLTPHLL